VRAAPPWLGLLLGAVAGIAGDSAPAIRWNEWSDTVFREALARDRPVVLYVEAAWCLECREFEDRVWADPSVRRLVDEAFLAVRVDRDRRPDLAARYAPGEPPVVRFLSPSAGPFLFQDRGELLPAGGAGFTVETMQEYLPVVRKYHAVAGERLAARRDEEVRRLLELRNRESRPLSPQMADIGINAVLRVQDPIHGGLQGPVRRVEPLPIAAALRHAEATGDPESLRFARRTLEAMARSPVRDPLEGTFYALARSPDWTRPAEGFRLGTQADMLALYLDAWRLIGEDGLREVAEGLVDALLLRFHVDPPSAFRASFFPAARRPADGVSWTDLRALSAAEREAAILAWDLPVDEQAAARFPRQAADAAGVAADLGISPAKAAARLRAAAGKIREQRAREWRTDDTVLSGDNARAAVALLQAWAMGGREETRTAALGALDYAAGRLASAADGAFHGMAPDPPRPIPVVLLADQIDLAEAWLRAYQLLAEPKYLDYARALLRLVRERFADRVGGGYFDRLPAPTDAGELRFPDRRLSENARAAAVFTEWSYLDPGSRGDRDARDALEAFADEFTAYGTDAAAFADAVDRLLRPPVRAVVVDAGDAEAAAALRRAAFAAAPLWKLVIPAQEPRDASRLDDLGIPAGAGTAAWVLAGDGRRGPLREVGELEEALAAAAAADSGEGR
jgi:hypothetical protein